MPKFGKFFGYSTPTQTLGDLLGEKPEEEVTPAPYVEEMNPDNNPVMQEAANPLKTKRSPMMDALMKMQVPGVPQAKVGNRLLSAATDAFSAWHAGTPYGEGIKPIMGRSSERLLKGMFPEELDAYNRRMGAFGKAVELQQQELNAQQRERMAEAIEKQAELGAQGRVDQQKIASEQKREQTITRAREEAAKRFASKQQTQPHFLGQMSPEEIDAFVKTNPGWRVEPVRIEGVGVEHFAVPSADLIRDRAAVTLNSQKAELFNSAISSIPPLAEYFQGRVFKAGDKITPEEESQIIKIMMNSQNNAVRMRDTDVRSDTMEQVAQLRQAAERVGRNDLVARINAYARFVKMAQDESTKAMQLETTPNTPSARERGRAEREGMEDMIREGLDAIRKQLPPGMFSEKPAGELPKVYGK